MAQCYMDEFAFEKELTKRLLFGDGEIKNPTGVLSTNHVRYQVGRQFSPMELKEMSDVMSYYKTLNNLLKKMEARK